MAEPAGGRVQWEPPDDFDPTEAIMRSLVAKAEGAPVVELEVQYAAIFLCAQALVARGVDVDMAIKACEQASDHGNVHITFSEAEGLNVVIGEDDEAAQLGRPSHNPTTCQDGHLGCELARDEQSGRP